MRTLLALTLAAAASAASLDGISIHYTATGNGPRTLILVHGWTCDETSWAGQAPALSKEYRVVTLDLPGHGKTPVPRDGQFSVGLFARAIEAVRAEVKADRVVLAGHSMGVPVVREFARLYPKNTAGLILVDGPMTLGANPPRGDAMGGPDGKSTREGLIKSMFSSATTPAMQKHILDMMLAAPEATAVGAMNSMRAYPGSDDTFDGPVLVVNAGGRSVDQAYIKSHFAKGEGVQVAETGHFLMLEKPDEFNRLVLAFLKKNSF